VNAPPILQAFVLADHVYTDAESGKRIVAGTFGQIRSRSFPTKHLPSYAFLVLTEFVGNAALRLRFVRARDNTVLMQSGEIEIDCDDPLAVLDFSIAIPLIPLPEEGLYYFECYVAESLIGSIRLQASLVHQG